MKTAKALPPRHNNLFNLFEDNAKVYDALQRDLNDDLTRSGFGLVAVIVFLVIAASGGAHDGWPWFVAAIGAALYYLNKRLDASNRNFLMHAIDWWENNRATTHQ